MTSKKIVMKVQMNGDKCRKKALKVAARANGVDSVANEGKEKELVTVIGISVDAVCLVEEMRKKVGHTQLISVVEVKSKEEKKEEKVDAYGFPPFPPCPCPQLVAYSTVYEPSPSICSIM